MTSQAELPEHRKQSDWRQANHHAAVRGKLYKMDDQFGDESPSAGDDGVEAM